MTPPPVSSPAELMASVELVQYDWALREMARVERQLDASPEVKLRAMAAVLLTAAERLERLRAGQVR